MKTVTAAFTDAWRNRHGQVFLVKVRYKRRYSNGSAYVYESAWTDLALDKFDRVGRISWKLDFPKQNEFKASNVTLYLNNKDNRWLPNNETTGILKSDATSSSGYEPFLMKFQVQVGFKLRDGTSEYVSLFTGLAVDYVFSGRGGHAEIIVSGNERLLQAADAQRVSTAFTSQATSPATGDGANLVFTTTALGVGRVTQVRVNGVAMVEGADYTLSNLNVYNTAATITFAVAPGNTLTVDATGRKWYPLSTIEDLAGLICDQAGIAAGDRSIQNVILPGGASGTKTIDTQADWEAGAALTNITTTLTAGNISRKWFLLDDFADGDYTASPAWIVRSGSTASVVTDGAQANCLKLMGNGSISDVGMLFSKAYGTWRFQAKVSTTVGDDVRVRLVGEDDGRYGYHLSFLNPGGPNHTMRLIKNEGGVGFGTPPTDTVLGSVAILAPSGFHEYRVTRTADGNFEVFQDGVSLLTATDTLFTISSRFGAWTLNTNAASYIEIDDIHWSPALDGTVAISTAAAVFESAIQDILSTPTAWGTLTRTETLNSGTIAYATAASADGVSFDAYVAIGADGTIASALKRYFKVRASITPASGSFDSPVCSKLVANFQTSQVFVSLANFSGKNCFTAMQALARLADYEIGFNGEGTFFFRSKTTSGSPTVELSQNSGIAAITQLRYGYDAIVNSGQVYYQPREGQAYFHEYNSTDAGQVFPSSQDTYGTVFVQDQQTEFLLANDASLATARARLIFEANYRARRRMKIKAKMTPQLDLSDIVRVTYLDDPKDVDNIFGDPLRTWLTTFGLAQNVLARSLDCKVLGLEFDPDNRTCEIDAQEILS